MLVMPLFCKNSKKPLSLLTGQITLKSNFFCQQNLTKTSISLLNRVTCITFSKMGKLDKSAAIGAGMLGILAAAPAIAEEPKGQIQLAAATSGVSQQVDCVAYAREGTSRADKKQRLKDCRLGKLDTRISDQEAVIAEQQRVLAELNDMLKTHQMRIDELGVIRDANDQELARVVAINGKLLVQRSNLETQIAQSQARQEVILDEIEAFIRSRG